jgi:hypothetical protein
MEDVDSIYLDFFKEEPVEVEINSDKFNKFIDYSLRLLNLKFSYCTDCNSFLTIRFTQTHDKTDPTHTVFSKSDILLKSLKYKMAGPKPLEQLRAFYLDVLPITGGNIPMAKIVTVGRCMWKLYQDLQEVQGEVVKNATSMKKVINGLFRPLRKR